MAARKSIGKVWNDEETRALIILWCDETIQVALDNSISSKDTSKVYKTLLVSQSYILHFYNTLNFPAREQE